MNRIIFPFRMHDTGWLLLGLYAVLGIALS
jgi:hypothetical protein